MIRRLLGSVSYYNVWSHVTDNIVYSNLHLISFVTLQFIIIITIINIIIITLIYIAIKIHTRGLM